MRKYRVRRPDEVDYIFETLLKAGIEVKSKPDPTVAPFVFDVVLPDKREYRLICYAFRANRYRQKGRPHDEHRFQVKYGSDFDRFHQLYLPKHPNELTLMFGIHFDRDLIVAVDPAMHEITRFSKSVEFKEVNLDRIAQEKWHGWERQRIANGRRKLPLVEENVQDEVLLGLVPERMLDYIELEAVASGVDPGTRLQIIDRVGRGDDPIKIAHSLTDDSLHQLESEMGFSAAEVADELQRAFRLKVALRGSIAERHLAKQLEVVSGVKSVQRIDKDNQPDLLVEYGARAFTIECKNVLRRSGREGMPKVDFQKTRASKGDPCSRYYRRDHFDILAACLEPMSERWEFRFCPTYRLDPHPNCEGKLSQRVYIDNTRWTASAEEILYRLTADR